jgi:hypothetical protein
MVHGDHRNAAGHCAGVIMRPMFEQGSFLGDWHFATNPDGGWNTDMILKRCHIENASIAILGTPGYAFNISDNQIPLCPVAMMLTNCHRGRVNNNNADLGTYWSNRNTSNGKAGAGAAIVFNGFGCSITNNTLHDYEIGVLGDGGMNRVQNNTFGLKAATSIPVKWVTKQYKTTGGENDGFAPVGRNLGGPEHPKGITLVSDNLSINGIEKIYHMPGALIEQNGNREAKGLEWIKQEVSN